MFATTPSGAAHAGGSPDWLDRQVARETHERMDEISAKRTPVATPASRDLGGASTAFPSAQRHRYGRDGDPLAPEEEEDDDNPTARDLFANLAAPPPSFAGARRAFGGAAAGAGLAGSLRSIKGNGNGVSLQDLIAGKTQPDTVPAAEVFSPSPAKEERRERRSAEREGEETAAGRVGRLGLGLGRRAVSAGQARGGRRDQG
jgi:hypothetical protein